MKENTEIKYKGCIIFLNRWGEYCVCHNDFEGQMLSYNSGFGTLEKAKSFIDKIGSNDFTKEGIERLATLYK